MHPIRELPRPRPRAWLQGTRPSLRRGHRQPGAPAGALGRRKSPLSPRSRWPRAPRSSSSSIRAAASDDGTSFATAPRAAVRRPARKADRRAHYEAGKIVGVTHAITHHEHDTPELDDVSLVRKVESELFRDRTIPKGPISINADRGIVVLRGQLEDPTRSSASSATSLAGVPTLRTCSTRQGSRRRQAIHTATRARRPGTSRPGRRTRPRAGRHDLPRRTACSSQRSEAPLQTLSQSGLLCAAGGAPETTPRARTSATGEYQHRRDAPPRLLLGDQGAMRVPPGLNPALEVARPTSLRLTSAK